MRSKRKIIQNLSKFHVVKGKSQQKSPSSTQRTRNGTYVIVKTPIARTSTTKKLVMKQDFEKQKPDIKPILQTKRQFEDIEKSNQHVSPLIFPLINVIFLPIFIIG